MTQTVEVEPPVAGVEQLPSQPKKGKKSNKKAKDRAAITPEYIEEQRLLRNLRKLERQQELERKIANETPQEKYIKRPLLEIPGQVKDPAAFSLKIMSYNMLAQGLVRRTMFPSSGGALKWEWRSSALEEEIAHYSPDLLCLQELDCSQFKTFWKAKFQEMGYQTNFHHSNSKTHGVCIVFKKEYFTCEHQAFISYDSAANFDEKVPMLASRTSTENIGMLNYLEFTPELRAKYPYLTRNGLIIGTTHLYWHPFGTFERTRQTYLMMCKFKSFTNVLQTVAPSKNGFYSFLAGDMNSQPYDSPYLSITSKPIEYVGRAATVLTSSLAHDFTRKREKSKDKKEEENEDKKDGENEGNKEDEKEAKPRIPVPDQYDATEEELALTRKLRDLHNSINQRAISLYSVGYKLVHPENAGVDNTRGEPLFSNWAHTWRGLLDYIFVVCEWDLIEDSREVDTIAQLEANQQIKLLKLLRMPTAEEMGPEPSGQPKIGQYPSDHLCIMAEVELL